MLGQCQQLQVASTCRPVFLQLRLKKAKISSLDNRRDNHKTIFKAARRVSWVQAPKTQTQSHLEVKALEVSVPLEKARVSSEDRALVSAEDRARLLVKDQDLVAQNQQELDLVVLALREEVPYLALPRWEVLPLVVLLQEEIHLLEEDS